MELIIGHNGLERLGIGSKSIQGGGAPGGMDGKNQQKTDGTSSVTKNKKFRANIKGEWANQRRATVNRQ